MKAIYIHIFLYLLTSAAVIVLNLVVAPTRPWFILIVLGWLGLIVLQVRNKNSGTAVKSRYEH